MEALRQRVKENCEAVYARVNELSEENAHEIAPLLVKAVDGCGNYILQNLNPISKAEYPFLIVAMQNIIGALKKEDPIAGLIASALSEVLGYGYTAVTDNGVLANAMRAMNGEARDGATGE